MCVSIIVATKNIMTNFVETNIAVAGIYNLDDNYIWNIMIVNAALYVGNKAWINSGSNVLGINLGLMLFVLIWVSLKQGTDTDDIIFYF